MKYERTHCSFCFRETMHEKMVTTQEGEVLCQHCYCGDSDLLFELWPQIEPDHDFVNGKKEVL